MLCGSSCIIRGFLRGDHVLESCLGGAATPPPNLKVTIAQSAFYYRSRAYKPLSSPVLDDTLSHDTCGFSCLHLADRDYLLLQKHDAQRVILTDIETETASEGTLPATF